MLSEEGCFAGEEDGGVGFAPNYEAEDCYCAGLGSLVERGEEEKRKGTYGHRYDPEYPSPSHSCRKETTTHGADDWAEEDAEREHGHGETADFLSDHVCDNAACVGEGNGAKNALTKPKANQHV